MKNILFLWALILSQIGLSQESAYYLFEKRIPLFVDHQKITIKFVSTASEGDKQALIDVLGEQEIKKNGINTAETDATLLQKIKELTLYMVDLNKKVESLQKENDTLRNKNYIILQKLTI